MVAGAHWALMPALASEIFGLPHLAGNYALLSVSFHTCRTSNSVD